MKTATATFHAMAQKALDEIAEVLARVGSDEPERLCAEILRASRIVCYGVGREGLMMRALCMRLMHLGLDAHFVGDMTTPPIGAGDLLFASAGPGTFSTVLALQSVAQHAGARVVIITAQPGGEAPRKARAIITLPAQTMANDQSAPSSILPLGSLYEAAQLIFFDLVSIMLRERMGQTPDQMRHRHTNLE